MRVNRVFFGVIIILTLFVFAGQATAQSKSREEREKEQRMAEEIDAQKKAIAGQKKKQEEMDKVHREAREEYDKAREELDKAMTEAREKLEEAGVYRDPGKDLRNWSDDPAFRWAPFEVGRYMIPSLDGHIPSFDGYIPSLDGGNGERTDWTYSRSVREDTFSSTYAMDVKLPSTVMMSVNGECKEGEIKIRIIMPGGKVYSDIMIDGFGNLNWRKSFSVSGEENEDKAGEWKFQIDASKATGFFRISFRAY